MNQLLNHFSELGSEYKLNFSSQAILKDCVIGLDGVHRKLLILSSDNPFNYELIDLNDVKYCSVKKIYGTINVGALKDKKLDQYLQKIILCFEFKTQRQPIEVAFYGHIDNHIYQAAELEQKAKDWESFLSKMLGSTVKKIA